MLLFSHNTFLQWFREHDAADILMELTAGQRHRLHDLMCRFADDLDAERQRMERDVAVRQVAMTTGTWEGG